MLSSLSNNTVSYIVRSGSFDSKGYSMPMAMGVPTSDEHNGNTALVHQLKKMDRHEMKF